MTDEYTPTTEQVLDNYVEGMSAFYGDSGQVEYARQFDRWLAAHDAEIRAKACDEGFNAGEPQPTDGPDYHAEHAAWQANRAEVRARAVMDFANLYLPTEYWYKARQHADNIRKGDA